jgi:hypothetical protein
MDKILLNALNNLSDSLEQIAAALKNSKTGPNSSTGSALTKGDFGGQLKEISIEIKSVKKDTQEILKHQKTILEMSKKKDKKTGVFEEAGGDKKSESNLKKGVGTILLIAVAVLAIGMAFKLVGKIDFLSVIALGAAMYVMSLAFEKIALLKLSLKESLNASLTMVMMAAGITMSSWILSLIIPIGITQALTGILIAGMFSVMSIHLENIFIAVGVFSKLKISKLALLTTLVSIAAAITMSSWILRLITPISFSQSITGILISVMFAVIAFNLDKIAFGVAVFKRTGVKPQDLLKALVGIAAAITVSSWILNLIIPMSFSQSITAILIAAMFTIIAFNLDKIAMGVVAFKRTEVKAQDLLLVLVGIAAAITVSSWILSLIVPIGLFQFLTALGIAILFGLMSYVMPELAAGIYVMEKALGKKGLFLMPLIFVAISLAIMLSSHILSATADIKLGKILQIAVFGVALAIMTLAMMPSVLLVGIAAASGVGAGAIALGVLMIPLIATAVVVSSHILGLGKYDKYPSLGWSLGVGLAMTAFGVATIGLGAIAMTGLGLVAILAGAALTPIIAQTIVKTDKIISKGKYDKYPGLKWILSVGSTMTGFGLAVLALGALAITGIGLVAILAGTMLVPKIAQTIVATDRIISKGKYNKYPSAGWILSVGSTMTLFGLAVVTLGGIALTGLGLGALAIIVGTKMVPKIAQTIVAVDKIISKGKYNKYPSGDWAINVGSLMTVFGLAVVTLGSFILGTFGLGGLAIKAGSKAVKTIAHAIVDVAWIFNKSSSAFKKGPTKDWAEGVGIAIGAFAPVYKMLVTGGIMKVFSGSGPSPEKFTKAIKTISRGIVDAAVFFAKNKTAFINGPSKEWSEGVGRAIGAFAPVYKILANEKGLMGSGVSVEKFSKAIRVITKGIISSAYIFAKNTAPFKEGNYPSVKWGKGVGAALGAFAPVFKSLSEDSGWFNSGDDVINSMVNAIVKISKAIVRVANIFTFSKANWGTYPTKKWSYNIKTTIGSFIRLVKSIGEDIQYDKAITVASKMARVAKILHGGKNYFATKIDPFFMKKVGQNILDFNKIVKKLVESEKSASGKIGSMNGALGNDPISQIARRMITLAKGYDAMASSLIKLGFALKTLNIKSLSQLGSITKSLSTGQLKDDSIQTTGKKFGERDSKDNMPKVGSGKMKESVKKLSPELEMKNNIWYMSKKLDETVELLSKIHNSTKTIDEYITLMSDGKVVDTPQYKK